MKNRFPRFLYLLEIILVVAVGCTQKSTNRPIGNGFLIITLKKGTYLNTNSVDFRRTIGENRMMYDSVQKQHHRLTGMTPTDTLTSEEYDLLHKVLKFQENDRLYCAFTLENIAKFYDKIKRAGSNDSSSVCSAINPDNLGLEFTFCFYDNATLAEINEQLEGVATVTFISKTPSNHPHPPIQSAISASCLTPTSPTPMEYQNLMRIKQTLWTGNTSWTYGKKASIVIVESKGDTVYNHCELNHKKDKFEIVSLNDTIIPYSHSYWIVGTLVADHKKRLTIGQKDCLGIIPKATIKKLILINGSIDCENNTSNSHYNTIFNGFLEGINSADGGDVVLFAMGADELPIDYNSVINKLTKIATHCLNIIIVESAGNDGDNLDNYHMADVSAIMVGAAIKSTANEYIAHFNYGHRIDCYAPGDPFAVPDRNGGYEDSFYGQTSGAAAIMAGRIVGLQSRFKAKHQRFFTPKEIKEAIKACNSEVNGVAINDNASNSAFGKRIPYTDRIWAKLQ